MDDPEDPGPEDAEKDLTQDEAESISVRAGEFFLPRTPISTRELFAGRGPQITELADAVAQTGLHVVIYGERGVGKTSLANIIRPLLHVLDGAKAPSLATPPPARMVLRVTANSGDTFPTVWARALSDVSWSEDRPTAGFHPVPGQSRVTLLGKLGVDPAAISVDDVRRILSLLDRSVIVFDEFDRLSRDAARPFTDLIKTLSDHAVDTTVVLVGVAETVGGLVSDHASIVRAITQIPMPRMTPSELGLILRNAADKLGIRFAPRAAERIVKMSQGLPHYTHLVGLHSVRTACEDLSRVADLPHVTTALQRAITQANETTASAFSLAIHSSHGDALYEHVLVACAVAAFASPDAAGFFQPSDVLEPCIRVLGRKAEIATFNRHLAGFCETRRGAVLERSGQERAYRYRFRDPLMAPYTLMRGVTAGLLTLEDIEELTS